MPRQTLKGLQLAYLLVVSLVHAHHDGTDHQHDHDHHDHEHHHDHDHKHEEERKALIMLEIEPNVNNATAAKDKRSPQHQISQASYGASPGQFVVRTATADDSGNQGEVPPEYLTLLQQLVAQQHQGDGENAPQSQLPVINELLIARNPDQSAVQFSNPPSQPQQSRRPPPSPQAQLQKLYFDSQFQQQIPVRPRLLRPPPQPKPASENQYSTVPATSQVYNIHEARLRASLAGSDPNLAVQALTKQAFPTTLPPVNDQQPTYISNSQEQLAELQSVPQSSVSHQQVFSSSPELQYVQQPVERAALYSSTSRQAAPSRQLISAERSKLSRRPATVPVPEQYLRETTQPLAEQPVEQTSRQQLTSDPKLYLASESGQQTPQSGQDDEFIQQLLSGGGRGLFPSSTPATSDVAEEIIKSTTALPSVPSRSSVYVTQRSRIKSSPASSKITIQEVGVPQEDAQTPLPVVHLPTPEGQRPLTQSELQALIDAGFNIQPVSEKSQSTQSITPQYYQQPTTKRQRSYVTPSPPRNQVAYQSRLRKQKEQKEEVSYTQQVAVQEDDFQQRPQEVNTRHRLQGSKPQQQQEEIVQYVRRPAQERRARPSQSRFRIVVGNSEPQEQTIQFVQVATAPDDVQQNEQLSTFQPDDVRTQQTTQLLRIQDERESLIPQTQTTRYQPETSELEQTYQTESVSLPQKTTNYQREEESIAPQRPRFHPIVVSDLPPTTPLPISTVSRRRRPRPPTHSRIVFRNQAQEDPSSAPASAPQQFLLSYDSIPEASSFGTRSRVRARRPEHAEES